MIHQVLPDSVYRAAGAGGTQYRSHHQDYDLLTDELRITSYERSSRYMVKLTATVANIPSTFLGFAAVTAPGTPVVKAAPSPNSGFAASAAAAASNSESSPSAAASVICKFILEHSITILGVDVVSDSVELYLDPDSRSGTVHLSLHSLCPLGILALDYVAHVGGRIGRIFCRLPRRVIRSPEYVQRLGNVVGVRGHAPIASAPSAPWTEWKIEVVDGRVVMWVPLCGGVVRYGGEIHSLLPTVGMSLMAGSKKSSNSGGKTDATDMEDATEFEEDGSLTDDSLSFSADHHKSITEMQIKLHQKFIPSGSRLCVPNDMLIVRTVPLRIGCLFGRVVESLLPPGAISASSNLISPTGDNIASAQHLSSLTLVFSGATSTELTHVPFEFFLLESFREQVPLSLRRTLPTKYHSKDHLMRAFASAPNKKFDHVVAVARAGSSSSSVSPSRPAPGGSGMAFGASPPSSAETVTIQLDCQAAVFVTKGSELDSLREGHWVMGNPVKQENHHLIRDPQAKLDQVTRYLHQQAEYPILSAINQGDITSEGVLLTKYFPSPVMKSLLLSRVVTKKVRAIVFANVSRSYGFFFSAEDRNLLVDLDSFGIQIFFCNAQRNELYQFTHRVDADVGMWVPVSKRAEYLDATFFGVYGSNLVEGDFESELETLLSGIIKLRDSGSCEHELLRKGKPLALLTGGGPGVMEVGNRVAKKLGILSCGMIVDFGSLSKRPGVAINEQKVNPFVEIFSTYRPEKLVERQADFHLHIPVFLQGGVGTDFEWALELVRKKVGTAPPHPMILFGDTWPKKITSVFRANLESGTIKGSEWLSNIAHVVETGKQALDVLTKFFEGTLPIGPKHPGNQDGYVQAK